MIEMQHVITFLTQMQRIVNIPITLYLGDVPVNNLSGIPPFSLDLSYQVLHTFAETGTCCSGTTLSPNYIFYGYIQIQDTGYCAYFGPCTSFQLTDRQEQQLLTSFHLPRSQQYNLHRYLNSFSPLGHNQFIAALELLHHMINTGSTPVIAHSYPLKIDPHNQVPSASAAEVPLSESYAEKAEREMLACIEDGKPEQLADLLDNLSDYLFTVPNERPNMMENLHDSFITSAALASRRAISGGMCYRAATDLMNYYLALYTKVTNYQDFNTIFRTMMLDFARQVASLKHIQTDSLIVSKMCRKTAEHIYDKYDLNNLAAELGLSPSYLSRHFKEKTGENFSTYLGELKIEEAKLLLSRTDLPLAEISALLSFSSQSYFQRLFHKIEGTTPAAWRRQNHYSAHHIKE